MKTALFLLGVLAAFGTFCFGLSLVWAWWERRRWERMGTDDRLKHFLKKNPELKP